MVSTIDDTKRSAIAARLADMKIKQELLISNNQKLIAMVEYEDIRKYLSKILEVDQKNLGVIETVIVQYGVPSQPREVTQKFVEMVQQSMDKSELSLYDKITQQELLKHSQCMLGIMLHKAAQQVGADVLLAFGPLNSVNFDNRTHQEQLKGMMEQVGTRELTGKDADKSLWTRVQDAVAALSGVFGSAVTQASDKSDMNIQDIIRLDHNKVNTLITGLLQSNDPQKIQEYFGQIYKDLSVHAEAEEQVVYPAVRSFYGDDNTQELFDEQAEVKQLLDEIKSTNPASSEFKSKIRQLMDALGDHIRQEESTMFAAIRNNCSTEQQEQMATQFKEAKSKLQQEMASAG